MLLDIIQEALAEGRTWYASYDQGVYPLSADTFDQFLAYVPFMCEAFDRVLLDGAVFAYLKDARIPFRVASADAGPSGVTTYNSRTGMTLTLNKHAWVHLPTPTLRTPHPRAMAGGMLCDGSASCLYEVVKHEFTHVIMFSLFLSLGMSNTDIQSIKSYFDPQHNVIFTHLLKAFWGQVTIDNSLLLKEDAEFSLTFDQSVPDIERSCIDQGGQMKVWYQGQWTDVAYGSKTTPHHSTVTTLSPDPRHLTVPNGLISCTK